jgi:predicted Zn finger-like uncharacterized protein
MLTRCPACDKQLQVGAAALGKKIRCPHCGETFRAPAADEPDEVEEVEDVEEVAPRRRREPPQPPPRRRREPDDRDDDDDDDYERDERPRRRRTRDRHSRHDDDEEPRRGMPGSVMLAIAALGLMLALELGTTLLVLVAGNLPPAQLGRLLGQAAVRVILSALVLWGLIAGHRLAWQWGRVLGLLGALLMLLVGIVSFAGGPVQGGMLAKLVMSGAALFISACLFTIVFSLGTQSAKKYFRLRCPECGRYTSSAADFFFNEAKCKNCGEIW